MKYLIDRQKLAIHAKRQIIQSKDMQCLRDIWKAIDLESSLSKESQYLTRNTHYRHGMEITKKLQKERMKTWAEIKCLMRHPVPSKLAHFTSGLNLETARSVRLLADRIA